MIDTSYCWYTEQLEGTIERIVLRNPPEKRRIRTRKARRALYRAHDREPPKHLYRSLSLSCGVVKEFRYFKNALAAAV